MHTPPSWPVIQPSGRSLSQLASTSYFGGFCASKAEGQSASINNAACGEKQNRRFIVYLFFSPSNRRVGKGARLRAVPTRLDAATSSTRGHGAAAFVWRELYLVPRLCPPYA